MKKIAFLLFVIVAGVVVITDSACTKDEKNNQESKTVVADNSKKGQPADVLALNEIQEKINTSGNMVFKIDKVVNNGQGKLPDFSFTVGEETHSFFELIKGKVVFLNFWGTWCPPCKREIPDIISLAAELKDKDFIVIGVPLERNAGTAFEVVSAFSKSKGINYLNFVDVQQKLAEAFGGISAVPTTYIIDKDGNIAQVYQGAATKELFLEMVNKVLK